MQEIKFEELSFKTKPLSFVLLMLSASFILLNVFDCLNFLTSDTRKWIIVVCSLYSAMHGLRPFYYRNYVQWNKRGMTLRVNNFWGCNFSFANVEKILCQESEYTVVLRTGKRKVINLTGIETGSKTKLLQVLQAQTGR